MSNETGSQAARSAASSLSSHLGGKSRPTALRDISAHESPRIDMRDSELNRVLGGGLVPGSIVLLGGEPGIGKSTLTLQTILNMPERKILYVSGEESAHQLKMRAERIGKADSAHVMILCETSLENIFSQIKDSQPDLVVIDSIQTISTEEVESSPGSLSQVRECAAALLRFSNTARSMLRRRWSKPVADRCGVPYAAVDTKAWVSKRKGRTPSMAAVMATPDNPSWSWLRSNSDGLLTARSPVCCIS